MSSAFEGSSIQSHIRHLLRTSTAVAVQSGDPLGKQKTGHLDIQDLYAFVGTESVGSSYPSTAVHGSIWRSCDAKKVLTPVLLTTNFSPCYKATEYLENYSLFYKNVSTYGIIHI